MNRYYKPKDEDFIEDLEIEVYDPEYNTWNHHVLESNSMSAFLPLLHVGDVRVKYLNSQDFNKVGLIIRKEKIGERDIIIDIIPRGDGTDKEIIEKENIFNEEYLTILQSGVNIGTFMPYSPFDNVIIKGKKQTVRNLTELRKILK